MWLKEVVVDGFKSYAHRTVIGRFDCAFTAITGLNGTGKSNILDAICFVLGITNLQQVRASSLSELVYKAGQAGVTSASVSLLFDNSDAQRSPVGYAEYAELTVTRVVVLGGKNKYLINGQTAQLSRVLNLFHSVGLNVNNPHFLIMQGRITRVIGMKPAELLSLIEEAAGTRMFESKKQAAVRTIDKKQGKVEEINCILHSEIAPQLQQLREDQQLLAQFTSKKRQLEQLERVHVAFTYTQQLLANKAHAAQARQQALLCEEKERLIEAMEEDIARQSEEEEQLQTELREKQTKGRSSTTSSTDFSALEDAVTRLSKTLVQVTAEYSHAKEAAETEAASLNRLSAQAQQAEGEESAAQQNVEAMKAKMERAEEELKAAETELTECRSRELGVGLDGEQKMKRKGGKAARNEGEGDHEEGGAAGGLHGQLMAKQRALSQLDGQLNLVRLQLKEVQTNIDGAAASNRRGGKDRAEHDKLKRTIEQQRRSLNDIDQQITSLSSSIDPTGRAAAEVRLSSLQDEAEQLRRQLTELNARLSRFEFSYALPTPTFDRSTVRGTVVSQLHLLQPETARAVETAAGGRLLNVIVDNPQVGKALLEKGQLTRRWTMIPLTAISTSAAIPQAVQRRAVEEVGADGVKVALDCVGYEARVKPAMQFVFGSTFVCPTTAVASKLTFHPDIARRTATLDGDILDPRGTMEGGSSASNVSVLAQFEQAKRLGAQLKEKEMAAAKAQAALDALTSATQRLAQLTTEREAMHHQLTLMETSLANNPVAQAELRAVEWTAEAAKLREEEAKLTAERQRLQAACAAMEAEMTSLETEAGRAASRAALQKRMAQLQAAMGPLRATRSALAQQLTVLTAQLDLVSGERVAAIEAVAAARANVERLRAAVDVSTRRVTAAKAEWDAAQTQLTAAQEALAQQSAALTALHKAKAKAMQRKKDAELECRRLQATAQKAQQAHVEGKKRIDRLCIEHRWIEAEEASFGRAGGDFDFAPFQSASSSSSTSSSPFAALQAEVASLSAKVNRKAQGLAEKAESDFAELTGKRDIIEGDKRKIEQVIAELEGKKRRAVEETWRKVNGDFGAIMASLLPGVQAALQPVDAANVSEGVEMRVAFQGVWKESLSELSGGQRSLLALSFILALLLFNPAPMYILDEIDAALDLSHTQNIGRMLKRHFPQSQFIIVSLKEGMFNNANVLFRTQFINGISAVTRTQAGGDTAQPPQGQQHKPNAGQGRKQQRSRKRVAEEQEDDGDVDKENAINH